MIAFSTSITQSQYTLCVFYRSGCSSLSLLVCSCHCYNYLGYFPMLRIVKYSLLPKSSTLSKDNFEHCNRSLVIIKRQRVLYLPNKLHVYMLCGNFNKRNVRGGRIVFESSLKPCSLHFKSWSNDSNKV